VNTKYTLHLVPVSGPTLKGRTYKDWDCGYEFKVIGSDLLSISRGQRITKADVDTQREYNGLEFTLKFQHQSVQEHIDERAADDYGFEQVAALLTRGQ